MSAAQLLEDCKANGVTVYWADGSLKVRGDPEAVKRLAPALKDRKAEIQAHLAEYRRDLLNRLEPFALDSVKDYPADVEAINRINNMAWEFMRADGMAFQEAIRQAAEIVVSCQVAHCEAAYTDVMALWQKLTNEKGI